MDTVETRGTTKRPSKTDKPGIGEGENGVKFKGSRAQPALLSDVLRKWGILSRKHVQLVMATSLL